MAYRELLPAAGSTRVAERKTERSPRNVIPTRRLFLALRWLNHRDPNGALPYPAIWLGVPGDEVEARHERAADAHGLQ